MAEQPPPNARVRAHILLDMDFYRKLREEAAAERRSLAGHMEWYLLKYWAYRQSQLNRGKKENVDT